VTCRAVCSRVSRLVKLHSMNRGSPPAETPWTNNLCGSPVDPRLTPGLRRNYEPFRRPRALAEALRRHQNMLAAMLIASASTMVLNANETTACPTTSLRIARVVTPTSEVCAVAAMVSEKYRKSL